MAISGKFIVYQQSFLLFLKITNHKTIMKATRMNSIKPVVIKLLTEYPHYRDDDRRLLAHIWMIQIGIDKMQSISLYDFMKHYIDNHELCTPDHISRMRRKVQEENVHLRGQNYNDRKKTEEEVRYNFSKK